MLAELSASNAFYRRKLEGIEFDPLNDPLDHLPFTTRGSWRPTRLPTRLRHQPDVSLARYTRYCQTLAPAGGDAVAGYQRKLELDRPLLGKIFRAAASGHRIGCCLRFRSAIFGFWGAFDSSVAHGFLSLQPGE